MKNKFSPLLLTPVLGLLLAGCAGQAYDPTMSSATTSPGDKIQVTTIAVKPQRLIAPANCLIAMKVKNVSDQPIKNIEYLFDMAADNREIGRGKIPLISPGESVEVTSDALRLNHGTYRIEGKTFLPKGQEEATFPDRMNNIKAVQFEVGQ